MSNVIPIAPKIQKRDRNKYTESVSILAGSELVVHLGSESSWATINGVLVNATKEDIDYIFKDVLCPPKMHTNNIVKFR